MTFGTLVNRVTTSARRRQTGQMIKHVCIGVVDLRTKQDDDGDDETYQACSEHRVFHRVLSTFAPCDRSHDCAGMWKHCAMCEVRHLLRIVPRKDGDVNPIPERYSEPPGGDTPSRARLPRHSCTADRS